MTLSSRVLILYQKSMLEAHVLTDGLAGAENRMIGIIALHHKSDRERHFPLGLLEKGLNIKIEETWGHVTEQFSSLDVVFLFCLYNQIQIQTGRTGSWSLFHVAFAQDVNYNH